MTSQQVPDYYSILEITPTATQQDIRNAYKKSALKHHPDRVPANSPERASRTRKFQLVNDAYYTLSDTKRRREYDGARTTRFPGGGASSSSSRTGGGAGSSSGARTGNMPGSTFGFQDEDDLNDDAFNTAGGGGTDSSSGSGWSSFPWSFFTKRPTPAQEEEFTSSQFGSVFEEMLREEGMAEGADARPTSRFWSLVGGLSGGALGFIMANFPGAVAGAVAGNRLGAVRDAKGKSVYAVFQELDQGDKARLLSELASKVFAHAVKS